MIHVSRAVILCLMLVALPTGVADAWDRGHAERFATLPPGTAHPEGLAADHAGNIWAADFDVSKSSGPGDVIAFRPDGALLRHLSVSGSSNLLLGLDFHPATGALLVIDFGAKNVLRVDPISGASTVFTTIPGGLAAGPNALTFDAAGNVYVSDSFQGTIWRTGPTGGVSTPWASSPLLATTGTPPFGANGLAFNRARTTLFVANTGDDTIVQIAVNPDGSAGAASVFTNSINGADGLMIDDHDNLWVCANQSDEIVVVDPTGKAIAKLGDFDGVNQRGEPIGLLFPASLVRSGRYLYVTNLSLDLKTAIGRPAIDGPWAAQVTRHTIARLPFRIPEVREPND